MVLLMMITECSKSLWAVMYAQHKRGHREAQVSLLVFDRRSCHFDAQCSCCLNIKCTCAADGGKVS